MAFVISGLQICSKNRKEVDYLNLPIHQSAPSVFACFGSGAFPNDWNARGSGLVLKSFGFRLWSFPKRLPWMRKHFDFFDFRDGLYDHNGIMKEHHLLMYFLCWFRQFGWAGFGSWELLESDFRPLGGPESCFHI